MNILLSTEVYREYHYTLISPGDRPDTLFQNNFQRICNLNWKVKNIMPQAAWKITA
jgi:hypothetical protein